MMRRAWIVVLATAVVPLVPGSASSQVGVGEALLPFGAGVAAADPDPLVEEAGPGCDLDRRAVAHHADGVILDPQPEAAPIPCMTVAGPAIEAATIGVTGNDVVFFASIEQFPLVNRREIFRPTVVARSEDRGETWEDRVPGLLPVSTHLALSTWMHVDPLTSRVWYATPAWPCGATVSWSDDDGETWGHYPNVGCLGQGAAVLLEGRPPAGAPPTEGYPHVVYYCANSADGTVGGNASVLFCHKSRDGGRTWSWIGSTPDPIPAAEGCPHDDLKRTRAGAVGTDGVLYFPTYNCGDTVLGLAVSDDEGATWTRFPALEAPISDLYPPALGIDTDNNLYIAWRGEGNRPYLTVSTDQGETWSEPRMIGAPEVSQFRRLGIVVRGPGHVLVSYLGTGPDGINGYITESRNALDPDPVFWSAAVNPPSLPLYSTGSETYGDRVQFLRGHIADDGTPWAAFHCFNTAPLCPNRQRLGIAGRLHHPSTN